MYLRNKIHKDTGHSGFQQVNSAVSSKSKRHHVIKKRILKEKKI